MLLDIVGRGEVFADMLELSREDMLGDLDEVRTEINALVQMAGGE